MLWAVVGATEITSPPQVYNREPLEQLGIWVKVNDLIEFSFKQCTALAHEVTHALQVRL